MAGNRWDLSYIGLTQQGIQLARLQTEGGRLRFTFRDLEAPADAWRWLMRRTGAASPEKMEGEGEVRKYVELVYL